MALQATLDDAMAWLEFELSRPHDQWLIHTGTRN